jgi:hypothetical protein
LAGSRIWAFGSLPGAAATLAVNTSAASTQFGLRRWLAEPWRFGTSRGTSLYDVDGSVFARAVGRNGVAMPGAHCRDARHGPWITSAWLRAAIGATRIGGDETRDDAALVERVPAALAATVLVGMRSSRGVGGRPGLGLLSCRSR